MANGFLVGFGLAAATVAPAHPPPLGARHAATGPALVGVSAAILVFVAGAPISILGTGGRHQQAKYDALPRPRLAADTPLRLGAEQH